jgi:predicted ester cyclase
MPMIWGCSASSVRSVAESEIVDRLLAVWTHPPEDLEVLETELRAIYTDPLTLNGATMALSDLVAFAVRTAGAFSEQSTEVLQVHQTDSVLAFAFIRRGRHTGTYASALGPVAATGRDFELRGLDLLTLQDGRISGGWAIADESGLLRQLGAVVQGST